MLRRKLYLWPFAKKLYHGWISMVTSSNKISWKLSPRNEELVAPVIHTVLEVFMQHLHVIIMAMAPFLNWSGAILWHVGCHFIAKRISWKKREISCDPTLTGACKPMIQSDSMVLVTRLWVDQVMTLTRLKKVLNDSDSSFLWLWLDKIDSGTSPPISIWYSVTDTSNK